MLADGSDRPQKKIVVTTTASHNVRHHVCTHSLGDTSGHMVLFLKLSVSINVNMIVLSFSLKSFKIRMDQQRDHHKSILSKAEFCERHG